MVTTVGYASSAGPVIVLSNILNIARKNIANNIGYIFLTNGIINQIRQTLLLFLGISEIDSQLRGVKI